MSATDLVRVALEDLIERKDCTFMARLEQRMKSVMKTRLVVVAINAPLATDASDSTASENNLIFSFFGGRDSSSGQEDRVFTL